MKKIWTISPLSVQENLIFVNIAMVNVVLVLNLKMYMYMLETIN